MPVTPPAPGVCVVVDVVDPENATVVVVYEYGLYIITVPVASPAPGFCVVVDGVDPVKRAVVVVYEYGL